MAYETTSVAVGRSRQMIEELLRKYGVSTTRFTTTAALFAVEFDFPVRRKAGYRVAGNNRSVPKYEVIRVLGVRIVAVWPIEEREQRRIARVLYWSIKSKLETVEAGVVSFEQEFLPHLTLGRGRTVWDEFAPRLEAATQRGEDLSLGLGETGEGAIQAALPEGRR